MLSSLIQCLIHSLFWQSHQSTCFLDNVTMINNVSDSKKITIDNNDNDVIVRMKAVKLNINSNKSNDREIIQIVMIIVYEN